MELISPLDAAFGKVDEEVWTQRRQREKSSSQEAKRFIPSIWFALFPFWHGGKKLSWFQFELWQ